MNPLCKGLTDADDETAEVLAALERLRDALQRSYDGAAARELDMASDLGPLTSRVERFALGLARDLRRVVEPHAKAIRREQELECVG